MKAVDEFGRTIELEVEVADGGASDLIGASGRTLEEEKALDVVEAAPGAPEDEKTRIHMLENRAALTRERLLRAVEALDQRRRQVVKTAGQAKEVAGQLKDLALPVGIGVVAIGALFGASALMIGLAVRSRRKRSLAWRLQRVLESYGIQLTRRPSLTRKLLEKSAATLVGLIVTELGHRATKQLLDGTYPESAARVKKLLSLRPPPPPAAPVTLS